MTLSPLLASLINSIDLSLLAVIGITTPGNKTVFFKGKIGIELGKASLFNASSSSAVIRGISSASDSISRREKLSKLV